MNERAGGKIKSVDKAMELIELLLQQRRTMTLQEIADASGYPKSTVHGLLATLCAHRMVQQGEDGRYGLGIRLFECGCAVSAGWDISVAARPHLEQLAAKTGGSAYIALLDGDSALSFDRCIGSGGLQVVPELGSRMPLHATAQGKLLLAQMNDKQVLKVLQRSGMQAFTPHTITDPQSLVASLGEIRRSDLAVEDGEYKIGLRSAASPVRDRFGQVRYALGVVGLYRKVQCDEFQQAIAQLQLQARQLSRAIGWLGTL